MLDKNTFAVIWELVPGRGAREQAQEKAVLAAERAAAGGKIQAVSITDNPGGKPALSATALGVEILKLGMEPLVHFTCKDKNRNQIEAELYALKRAGVRNLLVMSGDYPVDGFAGRPKPVFDLDPVHVLELVSGMNNGPEATAAAPSASSSATASSSPSPSSTTKTVSSPAFSFPSPSRSSSSSPPPAPGDFYAGAVVSPFKATEGELMGQYYKLGKKISHGAAFIVTQLGFDARKFHEVLQYIKSIDPALPVIGNIYILPYGAARMMNGNQLPGCVVPDKLLAEIDQERNAEDKGVGARLLRAAKMYAWMKGMGFDGVDIGGHNVTYEQIEYIIDTGEALSADWQDLIPEFDYPQPNGFYYFTKDDATGLNEPHATDRADLPPELRLNGNYRLMHWLHQVFFTPGKNLYPFMRRHYELSKNPRRYKFEHLLKVMANGCLDCGDCALLDLAYLCPMSQCPKQQRNGPCGGSYDGWCEVYPQEKKCIWVRAYANLKASHQESQLENQYLPPVNWDFFQTSTWYNYYTGRDHSGRKNENGG
ncbi:MAG TPA: methylenetetrahydrofolate reductase C-terminal domain-containing protein [Syntrophomonas sp.]|nr:methylenetetrahydrofolate reductase C-terminal domain-containing protein [Syntrophomonas sp.]